MCKVWRTCTSLGRLIIHWCWTNLWNNVWILNLGLACAMGVLLKMQLFCCGQWYLVTVAVRVPDKYLHWVVKMSIQLYLIYSSDMSHVMICWQVKTADGLLDIQHWAGQTSQSCDLFKLALWDLRIGIGNMVSF